MADGVARAASPVGASCVSTAAVWWGGPRVPASGRRWSRRRFHCTRKRTPISRPRNGAGWHGRTRGWGGDASPFWADTAMLEGRFARPEETQALVAQMDQVGGTPMGFRLLDGGLVLRLAQGRKTTQVGLANTVTTDAVRSRLMVLTPVDAALRVLHRSAAGVGSGGSSVTVRAWRPRRVERRRPVTFCQAVRARNGGGGERPQCAEIRRLRALNSAAGRPIPRADGTITAPVPGAWTNHRSGLTSHVWRWVESACVMLMVAKNCGDFPRLEKSN